MDPVEAGKGLKFPGSKDVRPDQNSSRLQLAGAPALCVKVMIAAVI